MYDCMHEVNDEVSSNEKSSSPRACDADRGRSTFQMNQ